MSLDSDPLYIFKPSADILTIVGIHHQDTSNYTLYGVVPRFWSKDTNAPKYESIDNETKVALFPANDNRLETTIRILKQSEPTCIKDPSERKQLRNYLKTIHKSMDGEIALDLPLSEEDAPFEKGTDEDQVKEDKVDGKTALKGIFELCRFYYDHHNKQKNKRNTKELFKEEDGSYSSDIQGLPLFLFQHFVQELQQNTRELRRTYRLVSEEIGSVRGRITRRGMINIKAKPSPYIECEFETFDVSAPIYRILKTVLDVISKFNEDKLGAFEFLCDELRILKRQANQLRNRFSGFEGYSVRKAISQARKLLRRIPRVFRHLEETLILGLRILLREKDILESEINPNDGENWWHISAPASKVWEALLFSALNLCNNGEIIEQKSLKGPWISEKPNEKNDNGNKSVDLVFKKNNCVFLFDAKYGKFQKTPKSGYQYQMYFYAMAYKQQVDTNLTSIALLHASTKSGTECQNATFSLDETLTQILDKESPKVRLHAYEIQFPQYKHLTSKEELQRYLNKCSDVLKQKIP